jgi:hypothetical protein
MLFVHGLPVLVVASIATFVMAASVLVLGTGAA